MLSIFFLNWFTIFYLWMRIIEGPLCISQKIKWDFLYVNNEQSIQMNLVLMMSR